MLALVLDSRRLLADRELVMPRESLAEVRAVDSLRRETSVLVVERALDSERLDRARATLDVADPDRRKA